MQSQALFFLILYLHRFATGDADVHSLEGAQGVAERAVEDRQCRAAVISADADDADAGVYVVSAR